MRTRFLGVIAIAAPLMAFAAPRDAHACGGCFHAETDKSTSFVSDHRMVFSISTKQTVLWDQVRFTGDPAEFAWVLPVRQGTRIELARDEWIQSLDQATQPSVKGPDLSCGGGGGGIGCGASMAASDTSDEANREYSDDAGYHSSAGVQVVSQEVVGPYDAVTVRSSQGEAIHFWLRINQFAVPDSIAPILDQYTREGFDFLALRLRPNQGVRSMRPVRVVMPGAVPVLPLRMVAAGIGAKVGLTLFVISEGRYHPKNFPDAKFDPAALAWDANASKSNYRTLVEGALAETGGRGWITEYAGRLFSSKPTVTPGTYTYGIDGSNIGTPLDQFYKASCASLPTQTVRCDGGLLSFDSGVSARPDAGSVGESDAQSDAALDAASVADAGIPPGPTPSGGPYPEDCWRTENACESFDDAQTALVGLHRDDVWVTRMRAELTGADCASGDLEIEPAPEAKTVAATLKTEKFTDPNFKPCANSGDGGCTCRTTDRSVDLTPAFFAVVGAAMVLRARRRRR